MSRPTTRPDSLRKLERLCTLLVEQAQVEHARAADEAESKAQALQRTEAEVAETQAFAREQLLISRALSADALLRVRDFAVLQEHELDAARAACRTSQDQCDAALDRVVERFSELSVIERLRARRRSEADKVQARLEQKHLDEHGLVQRAAAICNETTGKGE